jgi:hypothetical protein
VRRSHEHLRHRRGLRPLHLCWGLSGLPGL